MLGSQTGSGLWNRFPAARPAPSTTPRGVRSGAPGGRTTRCAGGEKARNGASKNQVPVPAGKMFMGGQNGQCHCKSESERRGQPLPVPDPDRSQSSNRNRNVERSYSSFACLVTRNLPQPAAHRARTLRLRGMQALPPDAVGPASRLVAMARPPQAARASGRVCAAHAPGDGPALPWSAVVRLRDY